MTQGYPPPPPPPYYPPPPPPPPPPAQPPQMASRGVLMIGLALGLAGFVISFGSHSSTSVNGRTTSESHQDYGAMLAAIGAAMFGLVALSMTSRMPPSQHQLNRWASIGLLGLAAVQLLRSGLLG